MKSAMAYSSAVIPEAAEGGYPGPMCHRVSWVPALAPLGRDDVYPCGARVHPHHFPNFGSSPVIVCLPLTTSAT